MATLSTIDQIDSIVDESEIVMDSSVDPDGDAGNNGVVPDEMIAVLIEAQTFSAYASKGGKK